MYGAILGDMIGSPYEFDQGGKSKEFPLFIESSHFTDDTVMTVAVADALMKTTGEPDDEVVREALVDRMQFWGRKYPDAGYGAQLLLMPRLRPPDPAAGRVPVPWLSCLR